MSKRAVDSVDTVKVSGTLRGLSHGNMDMYLHVFECPQ